MFDRTFAIYLGKNQNEHAAGFVVENGCFCVLEITGKDAQSNLRTTTEAIRETIKNQVIASAKTFEELMHELVAKYTLSSFAASYFHQSQIFTFTHNGFIFLNQGEQLYLASKEKAVLVGNFQNLDNYIYITKSLQSSIKPSSLNEIKFTNPKETIEKIKTLFTPEQGALLIMQTTLPEQKPTPVASPDTPILTTKHKPILLAKIFDNRILKLALLLVVFLFIGYQTITIIRSSLANKHQKELTTQLTQLQDKYEQTEQQLEKNPVGAIKEIDKLKTQVNILLNNFDEDKAKIRPLQQKILNLEKTYGNAKSAKAKIFFDLALISKEARADYLKITKDYVAIADNTNKKAYLVNITNKNVNELSYGKIKQVKLITEYNQEMFVYSPNTGIFKQTDNQFSKIVNQDKSWGNFIDLIVFNGNIYALDNTKDEIFKFTPTSDGYSDKISYFQPQQSLDLSSAKNMAIDFSVYILGNQIYKFTSGQKDGFITKSELNYSEMSQVYKNSGTNYLYLLDNQNSRIVVLNENGRLIKSIFNPLLKKGLFFGVHQDKKIIFLRQNKLYELDNF